MAPVPHLAGTLPASLSHFAIFNPAYHPTRLHTPASDSESDDKDLKDDLREAAQILFYTSREAGGVSRDQMLRQIGLAKGLMGFTDMVVKGEGRDGQKKQWYSIHSHRSRLVIYKPEPDFYIYVNITLSTHTGNRSQSLDGVQPPSTPSSALSSSSPTYQGTMGDPTTHAQGLSDRMIVDALSRGYQDFRFLHGPLPNLLVAAQNLSTVLDRFWTRFAFAFESAYLSAPTPSASVLTSWLGGYYEPTKKVAGGLARVMEVFREDSAVDAQCILGLVNEEGPLYIDRQVDPELVRYLVNLVQSSLPPPSVVPQTATAKGDVRQTLGFGLGRRYQDDNSRKSSWSSLGWVPGLGAGTPRSPLPAAAPEKHPSDRVRATKNENPSKRSREVKTRWPSLGLGGLSGLGEAMGTVGTVLGMGTSPKSDHAGQPARSASPAIPTPEQAPGQSDQADCQPSTPGDNSQLAISERASVSPGDQKTSTGETSTSNDPDLHQVKQSLVALPDLRAAVQADSQTDLTWDGRGIWFQSKPDDDTYIKRRLTWILRDNLLLFVLLPSTASLPWTTPSSGLTLSLYSKLPSILSNSPSSFEITSPSPPVSNANSSIWFSEDKGVMDQKGPEIDPASTSALADLRETLESDASINEVFARTPESKFVVAKRTGVSSVPSDMESRSEDGGELYMLVGKKDASLTDAEHAVRAFAR